MVLFKSIVVLDIETTSLPSQDHNKTKITELAFIGCEVEHIKNSKELPRVLHKLVLLFNPKKMIHPEATRVSGLSNELLSNVKQFTKEDVTVLRQFIERLPPPVCIVAHNGNKFDFPILRRALDQVQMTFQNNVYCADSIIAFHSLLPSTSTSQDSKMMTPESKTKPVNHFPHKRVARELFPEEEIFSELVNKEIRNDFNEPRMNGILKSYSLIDIYFFFFNGKFLNNHRAEEDSKALLSCIMKCDGFFEWINANAIIFNSIEPLF